MRSTSRTARMFSRMLKRLLKRGRSAANRREPRLPKGAVVVDYDISPQLGRAHLDAFYERVGYDERLEDGLLLHLGGELDDELAYVSLWTSEQDSLRAWQERRRDVEEVLASAGPAATVARRSARIHRLVLGDELEEFREGVAASDPDCVCFVIDIPSADTHAYDLILEQMSFPEHYPDGLILHMASRVGDTLRVISVWRHAEQSRRFLESRLMPAAVEVVRGHRVFPEIRPREMRIRLLALSSRLVG